jgi:hypothetical protein
VHPFPLCKEGVPGRGEHINPRAPPLPSRHPPGAPASSRPALHPLPPSRGLSKVSVGGRSHHRCTPSCCGVSGFLYNATYFRNLGWIGDSGSHHDRHTCVSMRRCRSLCFKIFATLRSATSSSWSTLVRERNPRVRSTRVCLQTFVYRYNITSR